MRGQARTVEQRIVQIAEAQHGVITRVQLMAAGMSPAAIERRTYRGVLHREHRGVYRLGHRAPSVDAQYLAAVYACGSGALLSGRAAGHLLGLLKRWPSVVEVTAPTERRVGGVRTRRSETMRPADATMVRSIPVTTAPRTLVDLAAVLGQEELARACHEAGVLHGTTPAHVEEVLARRPNAPGGAKLRRVLRGDAPVALSRLEQRFLELLREQRLALPETNRPAGGGRVDCRWPELRLTVELDGYRYHRSRHSWERDRRRERLARARGDEFRRYTYGDVFEHPGLMVRELHALLPQRRPA